jgi:hypothetical protein
MEKYIVVTYDLDWFGMSKGDNVIHDYDDLWTHVDNTHEVKSISLISKKDVIETLLKVRPDWFEKIEEKTYEILEYDPKLCSLETSKIIKVKRLSDGEIFSVGDKIKYSSDVEIIKGFNVWQGDVVMVRCSEKKVINLIAIDHYQEPVEYEYPSPFQMDGMHSPLYIPDNKESVITKRIVDIKPGDNSFSTYRGRILYARIEDMNGELYGSATLDFILRVEYDNRDQVINYKEALLKYLDFSVQVRENYSTCFNMEDMIDYSVWSFIQNMRNNPDSNIDTWLKQRNK